MTFFLIRARFTSSTEKFIPVGVLANDGVNIIFKEIANELESTPFMLKAVEKLKLKHEDKRYGYKDDPKLFLELLLEHFAGVLSSQDKFHPFFIGSMPGSADEVATRVSARLAPFGKNPLTTGDLSRMWPPI